MRISYNLADVKERKLAPIGVWEGFIKNAVYNQKSKSSDYPNLELTWKLDNNGNPDVDGVEINYDYISFSPNATWKQDEWLDALRFPRTCANCNTDYTEGKRIEREGLVCPNCGQKAQVSYDVGDGMSKLIGARCKLSVTQEANPRKPEQINNRIESYAPLGG